MRLMMMILLLTACGPQMVLLDPRGVLAIDPAFNSEQIAVIESSSKAWSEWTHGRVDLDLRIQRIGADRSHSWIAPYEFSGDTNGKCYRDSDVTGGVVGIEVRTNRGIEAFERAVKHELGHAFGLEHTHEGLMYWSTLPPWTPDPSKQSIEEFCAIWGCENEVKL